MTCGDVQGYVQITADLGVERHLPVGVSRPSKAIWKALKGAFQRMMGGSHLPKDTYCNDVRITQK